MKRALPATLLILGFIILTLLSFSYRKHKEVELFRQAAQDIKQITAEDLSPDLGAAEVPEDIVLGSDARAQIVDTFFRKKGMPLAGYGSIFVEMADKYGIDWDLLPAISVRESSGGKEMCMTGYNPFGWGSCRIYNFESIAEAIEYVSSRLGLSPIYRGLDNEQKLKKYNPPSIVPAYADEVMAIMADIRMTPPEL